MNRSPMPKVRLLDELKNQQAEDRARETRKQLRFALEIAKEKYEIDLLKKSIPTRATLILLASCPIILD